MFPAARVGSEAIAAFTQPFAPKGKPSKTFCNHFVPTIFDKNATVRLVIFANV
jgi:hypothetical protein